MNTKSPDNDLYEKAFMEKYHHGSAARAPFAEKRSTPEGSFSRYLRAFPLRFFLSRGLGLRLRVFRDGDLGILALGFLGPWFGALCAGGCCSFSLEL